jgi:toxin-antitoxin system PIN domain toxin
VTFLLDVNLLMALLWESHEHHDIARGWFRTVNEFATCPVTQLGFARVSSHPALGYGMSPDEAFAVLRRLLADSRHRFVPDDLSCDDRVVRTDWISSTNQVTDHYLVALARQHRVTLATFDEPLAARFAGEDGLVHWVRPR